MAEAARGRAYGLTLETDLPLPELLPPRDSDRPAEIATVTSAELDARFPPGSGERLLERLYTTGDLAIAVDRHAATGYRVEAPGFGVGVVRADGRRVEVVPPEGEQWRWQRLLFSQLLPTAAVLQGLEPLHAGGVVVGHGAVALLGASGMGKSSVGLHLVAAGATRLGDDLVVTELTDGAPVSHSGPGIAYVDEGELAKLGEAGRERVGEQVDTSDKAHLAFRPTAEPLPLRVICSLERGDWPELSVQEMKPLDPMLLMASAFVRHVDTSARAPRLLELCHAAASHALWLRLRIPAGDDASAAAAALLGHLGERVR